MKFSTLPLWFICTVSYAQMRGCNALYFPPTPSDIKIVESAIRDGTRITYKEVHVLCYQSSGRVLILYSQEFARPRQA